MQEFRGKKDENVQHLQQQIIRFCAIRKCRRISSKPTKHKKNRNKLDATEIETQIENDILTKSTHWVFFYSINQSINQSDLPKSIGSRVKRGGRQKQIVDVLMLLI